jgi:glutamine synthetase
VVAPELEFYLCKKNLDPDYPLEPPIGRSGRAETGRQSYGIDAVNEFDPIFEDMYDWCDAQGLDVDTLIHESGAAQVEINFVHGDPLDLADQAFLFKRTLRQAALRHDIYATFMAKPHQYEPGSAMHIHQSVIDAKTGANLFSTPEGEDTKLFLGHIAGLQKHLHDAMALLGPNVNSYRGW